MAVLVRSGRASIPALRRALAGAGCRWRWPATRPRWCRSPPSAPCSTRCGAVVNLDNDDPRRTATSTRARRRAASVAARRPRRHRRAGAGPGAPRRGRRRRPRRRVASPGPRRELLREAVLDQVILAGLAGQRPGVAKARRPVAAAARTPGELDACVTAEEVLWALWAGTALAGAAAPAIDARRRGRAARPPRPRRDVCAVRDGRPGRGAARPHVGVADFLATLVAQQIPADTLAERGVRGDVRPPADRAPVQGPGVAAGGGGARPGGRLARPASPGDPAPGRPDRRRRTRCRPPPRASCSPRSGDCSTSPAPARASAWSSRRSPRPTTTASSRPGSSTSSASGSSTAGSAAPAAVAGGAGRRAAPHRRRPTATRALREAAAATAGPAGRRASAPASAGPGGGPGDLVGHPRLQREPTQPVAAADEPVRLSASALTSLAQCPARWFLEREAGGERASTQAQGFGNMVHALADRVGRGEHRRRARRRRRADGARRRGVGASSPSAPRGRAARARRRSAKALARFLELAPAPGARTVVGHRAAGPRRGDAARRTAGQASRVRRPARARRRRPGRGGRPQDRQVRPDRREIEDNPQLGLYQLAVDNGAVDDCSQRRAEPGGAELWQLRHDGRAQLKVQARSRRSPTSPAHRPVETQLMAAAAAMRAEAFPARPGGHCEHCDFARSARPRARARCCRDHRGSTIATPADLQAVMGTALRVSPQQWAAISAPLEPAVVIAGAGPGKTTVMAARVVYLVATGQVPPEQVLGLTFTTKAASELAPPDPGGARATPASAGRAVQRRRRGACSSRRSRPTTPTPRRCSPSTACGSATSRTPG